VEEQKKAWAREDVSLWDLRAEAPNLQARPFPGSGLVLGFAFFADSKRVAVSGHHLDKCDDIQILDVSKEPAEKLAVLEMQGWLSNGEVGISPDGRLLAVMVETHDPDTGRDQGDVVQVWDVGVDPPQLRGKLGEAAPSAVAPSALAPHGHLAFSGGGQLLAVCDGVGRVAVYRTDTLRKVRQVALPGPVSEIAFLADDRHLAAVNHDGTISILRLWGYTPGR
jgi:hypothetical protein